MEAYCLAQANHTADLTAIASRQTKEVTAGATTTRIIRKEVAYARPENGLLVRDALAAAVNLPRRSGVDLCRGD